MLLTFIVEESSSGEQLFQRRGSTVHLSIAPRGLRGRGARSPHASRKLRLDIDRSQTKFGFDFDCIGIHMFSGKIVMSIPVFSKLLTRRWDCKMWAEEGRQDDQIRASGAVGWKTSMGNNGTLRTQKCLNCFKVVPEKYQLSWIKRWYSAGATNYGLLAKFSMASILVQPQSQNDLYFFDFFLKRL